MSEPSTSKRKTYGHAGERWVILTQYYPPESGAPQVRLQTLARQLTKQGIHVRVLTGMPNYPEGKIRPEYRGKWRHTEQIDGIEVQRVWLYPAAGRNPIKRLLNYFSFTFTATLYALCCLRRVDVLFVEGQPLTLGFTAILMKWLRGVPYVFNIPDLQTDVAQQLGFMGARLLLRIAVGMENFFMRRAITASTVTLRFIEYYVKRGIPRTQLSFLPNGADTELLRPLPYDEAYAVAKGVAGKKVFSYVGTHAFYHGLEVLIEAAERLQHRDDIVLLIMGDGPVRPHLIELTKTKGLSNVVFGDAPFPFQDMPRLMSISYAALAVLRNIPAANKMRLAKTFPPLACGVPVVFSGCGESAEMLVQHECGITAVPENGAALAQAIETLANDHELRNRLGENGMRLVQRELSWSVIISNWLSELRGELPKPTAISAGQHLEQVAT